MPKQMRTTIVSAADAAAAAEGAIMLPGDEVDAVAMPHMAEAAEVEGLSAKIGVEVWLKLDFLDVCGRLMLMDSLYKTISVST